MKVFYSILRSVYAPAKTGVMIVAACTAFAAVFNFFNPKGIDVFKPQAVLETEVNGLKYISVEKAKDYYDSGALLIDARTTGEYRSGHVKGAISITRLLFERQYKAHEKTIMTTPNVVFYCNGTYCPKATDIAKRVKLKGKEHVMVFTGGWDEWVKQRYPVEGKSK